MNDPLNKTFANSLLVLGATPLILASSGAEKLDGSYNPLLIAGLLIFALCSLFRLANPRALRTIFLLSPLLFSLVVIGGTQDSSGPYLLAASFYILVFSCTLNKEVAIKFRFLFETILLFYVISYIGFRTLFPEASKTDFTNANLVGLICIILAVHGSLQLRDTRRRSFSVFALVTALSCALVTSSRGAMVGVSAILVSVLMSEVATRNGIRAVILLCFGIFIIVVTGLLTGDAIMPAHIDHLRSRIFEESAIGDVRIAQLLVVGQAIGENIGFLVTPIPVYLIEAARGTGFSDNSVLELAGYIGIAPALLSFVIITIHLSKQSDSIVIFSFLYSAALFNTILMTAYISLFAFLVCVNSKSVKSGLSSVWLKNRLAKKSL